MISLIYSMRIISSTPQARLNALSRVRRSQRVCVIPVTGVATFHRPSIGRKNGRVRGWRPARSAGACWALGWDTMALEHKVI
jgi:hypothetical protein